MKIPIKFYLSLIALFICISSYAQDCEFPIKDSNLNAAQKGGKTLQFNPPPRPKPNEGSGPRAVGDRVVFWVHGLGGNGEGNATSSNPAAWKKAGIWSRTNYELQDVHPTYSGSQFYLEDAAHELETKMIAQDVVSDNAEAVYSENYIIAHSQGGVVTRQLDMMYNQTNPTLNLPNDRRFGGMVTFGSPHQGAKVINNKDMFPEFTGEACVALGLGPIIEKIETDFWLDLFLNGFDIANSVTGEACGFLENFIVPTLFSDFDLEITEEYAVGTPQMATLNNHNTAMPRLTFYGEEDEPVIWKVLSSLVLEKPNSFDFGSATDTELTEEANSLTAHYIGKYYGYKSLEEYWEGRMSVDCNIPVWTFVACPIVMHHWQEAANIRIAYERGMDFMLNANDYWKSIIGAKVWQQQTRYSCTCLIPVGAGGTTPGGTAPISLPDSGDGFYIETFPVPCSEAPVRPDADCNQNEYTQWIPTYKASDGIVLAESAGNLPGASASIRMQSSNHQQMRNDYNLSQELPRLFIGQRDPFFIINIR